MGGNPIINDWCFLPVASVVSQAATARLAQPYPSARAARESVRHACIADLAEAVVREHDRIDALPKRSIFPIYGLSGS
jgi:hypothetical protein